MIVRELIALLEDMDPEATVLIASQPSWPFEYSVAGVVAREEVRDEDADEEGERTYERGTAGNDVFIVEGDQLRYGSKTVWGAVR